MPVAEVMIDQGIAEEKRLAVFLADILHMAQPA
jgi:hypothetical protein